MTVFVDTSALYALIDRRDPNHGAAAGGFLRLLDGKQRLLTHNYVLLEATALVHRRLGPTAARELVRSIGPALSATWVDEEVHDAALVALLASERRRVSLVDWVSFEVMRLHGIEAAFAFDRDFAAQGFETIP